MRTRIAAVVATGVMCAAAMVALAGPAHADLVTRCVGEGGAVTVPGDLVVPAGRACALTGTTVQGNVRVAAGADLVVADGTLHGTVTVADDGYLDTTHTTITGQVTLAHAYGASLATSTVPAGVLTKAGNGAATDGFVHVTGSLLGTITVRAGQTEINSSQVAGNLTADGGAYTDLYSSFVDGKVQVSGNTMGGVVCGSAVHGAATYTGNQDAVQLGGDGPVVACAGSNYWAGTVHVADTSGGVYADRNIINGNLVLTGNDPIAWLGSSNLVAGKITGDYQTGDTAHARSRPNSSFASEGRDQALTRRAAQRRQQAIAGARAAGEAGL